MGTATGLGRYGEGFGKPVFDVTLKEGRIAEVTVRRGAPCGATWEAARRIIGLDPQVAIVRIGLETQFFCSADPAGWDPIYGKSPVHYAGERHSAALKRAIESAD